MLLKRYKVVGYSWSAANFWRMSTFFFGYSLLNTSISRSVESSVTTFFSNDYTWEHPDSCTQNWNTNVKHLLVLAKRTIFIFSLICYSWYSCLSVLALAFLKKIASASEKLIIEVGIKNDLITDCNCHGRYIM